jgi:hypothetical protein
LDKVDIVQISISRKDLRDKRYDRVTRTVLRTEKRDMGPARKAVCEMLLNRMMRDGYLVKDKLR